MGKGKNKSSSTPKRKRYNKNDRAEQYNGKNIAKGYSNWFGVDLVCAINELEVLGSKFNRLLKNR